MNDDIATAMQMLMGYRIQESAMMVEPVTTVQPRSWRERLLTLPWRPWQRTKYVTENLPSPTVIFLHEQRTIVAHPETIRRMRDAAARSAPD